MAHHQTAELQNQKNTIRELLIKEDIPSEVCNSPTKSRKLDLTIYFDTESSAIEDFRFRESLFDCISRGTEKDTKNIRIMIMNDPS
jgi:hypothetical protein